MPSRGSLRCCLLLLWLPCAHAQSVSDKWNFFASETATPLTLAAAGAEGTVTQATRFAPLYGAAFWRNAAFFKSFGAAAADNASRNFFADFLLASAFHEDTRYVRQGPSRRVLPRIGYALSRAVIARTDAGAAATFNWADVAGSAMSAAMSNAYYPPVSRTAGVSAVNWGTNVAGAGFSNLLPEFGPDIAHWWKKLRPFRH